jgi:hypothetical protein
VKRDTAPLSIALPDGRRAEYVAGTRPARYTIDGALCAIDVTIPDDLVATGWYWSGSFLYQPWPGPRTEAEGRGPGVAIATCTFPPPGYVSDRKTCFEAAYEMEAKRGELSAALAARPAKKVKASKKIIEIPDMPIETAPEPELAYEQAELML